MQLLWTPENSLLCCGRDGKIYIAALNVVTDPNNNFGLHILGCLSEQRFAISRI
ncbi:hypothetical protein RND71_027620 [Anisodus tanguticus]|uniref:Uncharacterized protein n=1 Tax=Anisodus tanguticus TaxID=243964 RepID=A0AAE1V1W7_9SOLA|nr:hypothetical protein RND71_027620 [Anisodus tanguticus]